MLISGVCVSSNAATEQQSVTVVQEESGTSGFMKFLIYRR
jgi:hypothetical protein